MSESELLYAAASAKFGIIVTGSVKRFRDARSALRDDIALSDLAILGPDERGQLWLVKRSAMRDHLITGEKDVS
jgi:hypothetical protein